MSNHATRRHRPGRRATTRARLAEADANAPQARGRLPGL
jgi:hypothetical protein